MELLCINSSKGALVNVPKTLDKLQDGFNFFWGGPDRKKDFISLVSCFEELTVSLSWRFPPWMAEIADLYPLMVDMASFLSNKWLGKSAIFPIEAEVGSAWLSHHHLMN